MPALSVRKHPHEPARQPQGRRAASRQRGRAIAVGLIVLVLGIVAAALVYSRSAETISGIMTFSDLSRDHVNGPVTYAQVPPLPGRGRRSRSDHAAALYCRHMRHCDKRMF
ncbi:MAG: hypothetical protein ACJ8CR_14340 [Roseiflexaceae bacterium]